MNEDIKHFEDLLRGTGIDAALDHIKAHWIPKSLARKQTLLSLLEKLPKEKTPYDFAESPMAVNQVSQMALADGHNTCLSEIKQIINNEMEK